MLHSTLSVLTLDLGFVIFFFFALFSSAFKSTCLQYFGLIFLILDRKVVSHYPDHYYWKQNSDNILAV